MKKNVLILFCLLAHGSNQNTTITNAGDCGYLGDQLMNYIKAKYLSFKYNIPFQLRNFTYSHLFMLDDLETKLNWNTPLVNISHESQLNTNNDSHYNLSLYSPISEWADAMDMETWVSAFSNPTFMQHIRAMISLKNNLSFTLPQNKICIAVHIRKPLTADIQKVLSQQIYDSSQLHKATPPPTSIGAIDVYFPDKFLPDQYYIDQIKRFKKLFPDKPILVYIFTNDPNVETLCALYKKELADDSISFTYSTSSHENRVAEDLITISKFDYIIRSKSNFTQVADFIGTPKIVISPDHFTWYKNEKNQYCLVVETVLIKEKNEDGTCTKNITHNISQSDSSLKNK